VEQKRLTTKPCSDERHICCSTKKDSRRNKKMKPNIIGIVGGIIALVSLALPWWTMTMSGTGMGTGYSAELSIYPYQVTASSGGMSMSATLDIWYGWVAFALVVVGGLLGIMASAIKSARMILAAGGVLALLSAVVFALGLQSELTKSVVQGWPVVGLFSSGSLGYANYMTYLSFGFWLALIAGIIMLVAMRKKPEVIAPAPVPPPPPT
jgi:hypothetical protein